MDSHTRDSTPSSSSSAPDELAADFNRLAIMETTPQVGAHTVSTVSPSPLPLWARCP